MGTLKKNVARRHNRFSNIIKWKESQMEPKSPDKKNVPHLRKKKNGQKNGHKKKVPIFIKLKKKKMGSRPFFFKKFCLPIFLIGLWVSCL